jgi:lipoprotein-anchoring transpeptidase ErfK/SrfK
MWSMNFFRTSRGRSRAAAVIGLVAIATLTAACGGSDGDNQAAPAPSELSAEQMAVLPAADTFGTIPNPDVVNDPSPTTPTQGEVLHPHGDLPVYNAPNGKPIAKLPELQMGSKTWVPVVARQGDWAQVLLPTRPNASSGWVHATSAAVDIAHNDAVVNVDVKNFKLEILKGGQSQGSWTIGTGTSEHPTPTGRAYIMASIAETVNKYSKIVLPLSFHSNSLETFGGAPGVIGMHTWPDDSFVGKASSDGCIRVTPDVLDKLAQLPLGTVVNIT